MKKNYIKPVMQDLSNVFDLDLMVIVDSDKSKVIDDEHLFVKGRGEYDEVDFADFNPDENVKTDNGLW